MKRILKKSIMLAMILFMFIKCNKQLDLRPLGQLTEENFFQTEEDFESASLAPYATMLSYYYDQFGGEWYQPVLYPDDDVTVRSNETNNIEDFNWLPDNGNFRRLWEISYRGVNRANIVIEQLPKAAKFQDEKNKVRYEAEAKFMRAYFNFILAINWGTPPLLTKTIKTLDETRLTNSKPGEIWDLIVSDLNFAKQNLPATYNAANTGRATKGAATGMLGKVLLYRAQWENKPDLYAAADAEFTSVINSNTYRLVNFSDNFDVNTENNPESLFEVQFAFGRDNNWFPNEDGGGSGTGRYIMWRTAGEQGQNAPGANADGYGFVHIVKPLQDAFEPGDPRRAETIYLQGDAWPKPNSTVTFKSAWSVTGSTPAKYIRRDRSGAETTGWQLNYTINNERVLRYADILLMSAECKILGPSPNFATAASLINQVRRRADTTGTILPNVSASLDRNGMFRALMQERRVELALESHRYNDLVRWHRANLINIKTDINFGRTPANNNWSTKNLLKPIPLRDLDLNKNMTQNPGY